MASVFCPQCNKRLATGYHKRGLCDHCKAEVRRLRALHKRGPNDAAEKRLRESKLGELRRRADERRGLFD